MSRRFDGERKKEVVPIKDLFQKYRTRLHPPQGAIITAAIAAVEIVVGITLSKQEINYNTRTQTIHLTITGPKKTEILLRKKEILKTLKDTLGAHAPHHLI